MEDLNEALKKYRDNKIDKKISFKEKSYAYNVLGEEHLDIIIFLPGGSGISEPYFEFVNHFSSKVKCISLDFPELKTMKELCELLVSIINKEKKNKVYLFGQSMGGMLAQVLMYKYPNICDKIILCHTSSSTKKLKSLKKDSIKEKERKFQKIIKFPLWLLKILTKYKMKQTIKKNGLSNFSFWNKLFMKGVNKKNKDNLIAPIFLIIDFIHNYTFEKSSFKNIEEKILIIDSKKDPAFSQEERESLYDLMPKAKKIHLDEMSHLGLIEDKNLYIEAIENFIFL